jgi:hypothetical protein
LPPHWFVHWHTQRISVPLYATLVACPWQSLATVHVWAAALETRSAAAMPMMSAALAIFDLVAKFSELENELRGWQRTACHTNETRSGLRTERETLTHARVRSAKHRH